jgi:hypothetical protein
VEGAIIVESPLGSDVGAFLQFDQFGHTCLRILHWNYPFTRLQLTIYP